MTEKTEKSEGVTFKLDGAALTGILVTVLGFILLTLWGFNSKLAALENKATYLTKVEAQIEASKVELNSQIAEVEAALDKVADALYQLKLDIARGQVSKPASDPLNPLIGPTLPTIPTPAIPVKGDRVRTLSIPKGARDWRKEHAMPKK